MITLRDLHGALHWHGTVHTAHALSALPILPEVGVPEVVDCACVCDDNWRMHNARPGDV